MHGLSSIGMPECVCVRLFMACKVGRFNESGSACNVHSNGFELVLFSEYVTVYNVWCNGFTLVLLIIVTSRD